MYKPSQANLSWCKIFWEKGLLHQLQCQSIELVELKGDIEMLQNYVTRKMQEKVLMMEVKVLVQSYYFFRKYYYSEQPTRFSTISKETSKQLQSYSRLNTPLWSLLLTFSCLSFLKI